MEANALVGCRNDDDVITMDSLADLESERILNIEGNCFDLKSIYNWVFNLRKPDGSLNSNPFNNLPFTVEELNTIKETAFEKYPLTVKIMGFPSDANENQDLVIETTSFSSWNRIFINMITIISGTDDNLSIYEALNYYVNQLPNSTFYVNLDGYAGEASDLVLSNLMKIEAVDSENSVEIKQRVLAIQHAIESSEQQARPDSLIRKDRKNYKKVLKAKGYRVRNFLNLPSLNNQPAPRPNRPRPNRPSLNALDGQIELYRLNQESNDLLDDLRNTRNNIPTLERNVEPRRPGESEEQYRERLFSARNILNDVDRQIARYIGIKKRIVELQQPRINPIPDEENSNEVLFRLEDENYKWGSYLIYLRTSLAEWRENNFLRGSIDFLNNKIDLALTKIRQNQRRIEELQRVLGNNNIERPAVEVNLPPVEDMNIIIAVNYYKNTRLFLNFEDRERIEFTDENNIYGNFVNIRFDLRLRIPSNNTIKQLLLKVDPEVKRIPGILTDDELYYSIQNQNERIQNNLGLDTILGSIDFGRRANNILSLSLTEIGNVRSYRPYTDIFEGLERPEVQLPIPIPVPFPVNGPNNNNNLEDPHNFLPGSWLRFPLRYDPEIPNIREDFPRITYFSNNIYFPEKLILFSFSGGRYKSFVFKVEDFDDNVYTWDTQNFPTKSSALQFLRTIAYITQKIRDAEFRDSPIFEHFVRFCLNIAVVCKQFAPEGLFKMDVPETIMPNDPGRPHHRIKPAMLDWNKGPVETPGTFLFFNAPNTPLPSGEYDYELYNISPLVMAAPQTRSFIINLAKIFYQDPNFQDYYNRVSQFVANNNRA